MKAKTKLTKLWSILLAFVMVVGMLPTVVSAEEPDAFLQFADAPGEFFYRNDGGYDSEGPTEDTTFTLTEPTMITGIWTYHYYAANYDIDFSKQTIQLKDTDRNTVVYTGAVRIGHYANTIDCDWIVLPNIVLQAGTYQVIDSHHESWCALNSKGVCMVKGYSTTPSTTTYTVSFNANGGSGIMADVTGVSGEYTLPANGFTAPNGMQFKAWSVGGNEKAVGDKITVTANTTVTAVWENIPAGHTCDIKPVAKVNPTCTEDGNIEYYTCSGCGKLYADATGNVEITADKIVDKATGHQYAWVIDKEATETETGIKHEECACGAKRNENTVIPIKADNTEKEVKTNNSKKSPATGNGYEALALLAIILASGSGVVAVSYGRKKKEQAE